MKPIKMLGRVLRRRETIVDERRAIVAKIYEVGSVIAQDKESCSSSKSLFCSVQCDVLKAASIRQVEIALILDLPFLPQALAEDVTCNELYDYENELQGPTLSEAIKQYRGVREGTILEKKEFDRRYHYLFHLESQGFLPLWYDYINENGQKQSVPMPIRLYLKWCVSNILREIMKVPNRKQSTLKDDLHRFKVFVNLMSQLAIPFSKPCKSGA